MIRASGLCFSYPEEGEVVSEIDLELAGGDLLAIIGPNGSGKSTLLKLLAGILSPSAGSVLLNHEPLAAVGRQELAKQISYVPQQATVALPFTVGEVVLMGRHPYQRPFRFERPEDLERVRQALTVTDMTELAHRPMDSLSGGEQQRVMIARAIAQDARIVLLDEPTAALDLKHEIQIWEILERLAFDQGRVVVGVTHHINLASLYSPRLLVLKKGRAVAVGAPSSLLQRELMESVYETPVRVESPSTHPPFLLPERRKPAPEPPLEKGYEEQKVEPLGVLDTTSSAARPDRKEEEELHVLSKRRFAVLVSGAALLLAVVLIGAPLVGPTRINLARAFDFSATGASNPDASILFVVRFPRTLLAALVGAALSISGLTFQSLLRNPLASPFTLGISGGAAVATALTIRFGLGGSIGPFSTQTLAALAGSGVAVLLVYLLAQVRGYLAPSTMLLAGVSLHFFFSSLILLIQYTADFTQSYQIVRWFMGGLDIIELEKLAGVAPLVLVGVAVLVYLSRQFNVMALGEETAQSLGVPVKSVRRWAFAAASLATGAAISLSGPILFVGLMVPHLLRLLIGPDHRLLMPISLFAGGAFVVLCDTLARTVLAPIEIPVGVVTALLGGPFFIWLLFRHKLRGIYSN